MRHERRLAEPQKDGIAYRVHLEKVADRMPAARKALEGPPLPEAGAYVWTWFLELNAARAPGFAGITPLSFLDMQAWAQATGRSVRRLELQWLKELDRIWCGPAPREEEP